MFVLENIQKVEIIGGNSIDWLNISCTFFSVFFGAVLAYYFSIKVNKNNNKRDYKNNLLHETLKHINLLQDVIIKRNEMINKMLSINHEDKQSFNDCLVSILVINNNIFMHQNDIKVKAEILKTEIDSVEILEKLVNDCNSVSEDINQQVMFMCAAMEEAKVKIVCFFNISEIEKKYKIHDTIYDSKRMIETKLKENKCS